MKKIVKLLVLLVLFSPLCVKATFARNEYGSYETAQKMVKEVMKSYYIRGKNIQYNYAKTNYPIGAPEEATSQDINYSVCAAYTYSVYNQAFGMLYDANSADKQFPRYNSDISKSAYEYLHENIDTSNGMNAGDGTYLIYYQHTLNDHPNNCSIENKHNESSSEEKIKYLYGDTDTKQPSGDLETLINNMMPGDLVVYSGHALIVYDVVTNPSTGKKDALILNSTMDEYIRTRIDGTMRLTYNMFKSPSGNNGFIDIFEEGAIQFLWLSEMKSSFINSDGNLSCQEHECAVIRPFYNKNGKAAFNYPINESQYKKAILRTEYPGLLIEKTVDKHDNNSIYVGDQLTYTIKITNKSGVDYNSTAYNPFYIEETLGEYVNYITSSNNGSYAKNKIKWYISGLRAGESITLTYTVKVKEDVSNVGKIVTSTGKFSSSNDFDVSLTTGTVKNKIIPKVTTIKKSYKECYNENKENYSGLELISKIYDCAHGSNLGIDANTFDFKNIFSKSIVLKDGEYDPKTNSNITIVSEKNEFYRMVLNDYLGGLVTYNDKYYLPRFSTKSVTRAKTIYPTSFKDGDVLIYDYIVPFENNKEICGPKTNEEGLYAYIYIDGKFVGVNKNTSLSDKKDTTRNEFTYIYYGETYARNAKEATCNDYFGLSQGTLCNYKTYLWEAYGRTGVTTDLYEFINYQTLFDKDNFVILRPELLIKESIGIEINSLVKTKYIQNYEKLDLTGGTLNLKYNDGTTDKISLTNESVTVTGFDNSKVGKNTITVEYQGHKATFNVEIISKQSTKIALKTLPLKTTYIQNYENLDLTGGSITVTYNDKTTDEISLTNENVTVTGFDNSKVGENTITVEYNGHKATFNVDITTKQSTKIEIKDKPLKTTYIQNYENLDLTGGTIIVTYNDKTTDKISLTNESIKVTGFDNSKLGKNTITVEYNGHTITFDVEIISKQISKVEVSKLPNKIKYTEKLDELDLTGGLLTITYTDETTDEISLTNESIKVTGFDNSKVGQNTITIKYLDRTATFDVEIVYKDLVDNPKTGLVGCGILLLIFIASGIVYIKIRRNSKFLNHN